MPNRRKKSGFLRALALLLPLCLVAALAVLVAMSKRQADLNRQLSRSIREGRLDAALALLQQGADPDGCADYQGQADFWSVFQGWFQKNKETPSASSSGLFMLLDAVSSQMCDCSNEQLRATVTALVNHGAAVNITSDEGFSLIYLSVMGPSTEITCLLLKRGANPDLPSGGRTPLMQAAGWAEPEDARLLLDAGADINRQDSSGDTALMYAVYNGREENVETLLEKHPNVNLRNQRGETALQIALSSMKSHTRTPFHAMDDEAWQPIVSMLKKHGGKP